MILVLTAAFSMLLSTENVTPFHFCRGMSGDVAKYAAVEFAAAHCFGPRHDLEPEVIAGSWCGTRFSGRAYVVLVIPVGEITEISPANR